MRAVDYIIVGQGIAGSCLALELVKRKKKLLIIDSHDQNAASKIAAGIFNPITGRTNQPTWLAKEVFKTLFDFYSSAENLLEIKFLNRMPIYRPFLTVDENGKWPHDANDWIQRVLTSSQYKLVHDIFGGIIIRDSGYLETNKFLLEVRNYLQTQCDFLDVHFELESIQWDRGVHYKNFTSSKIIFCEGCAANSNPLFNWLPIRKLKGELLTIKGNLPTDVIVNRGIFSLPVVPNEFILGSTYVHDEKEGVTIEGKEEILSKAKKLFKGTFEIVDHSWGHRPTTVDRRPILGSHPEYKNVLVFNGLGTKGISLAPFFALHLADWLEGLADLNKEINIARFYSLSFKSKLR